MAAEVFGLGSLGVLLGATELAVTAGHAIGSLLGGWIYDISNSYQLAFLITAALAIVAAIIIPFLKPKSRSESSHGISHRIQNR